MTKKTYAVVGPNEVAFQSRLDELAKIFRITRLGRLAYLGGGLQPIELIFIEDPEELANLALNGYLFLPGASDHPNFEPICAALPGRVRGKASA